ncbi:MAG: hypothetical protein EXR72_05785 [Myxococcales bacterium]|nr:hypothetical protein [Myxococcales bacterium]
MERGGWKLAGLALGLAALAASGCAVGGVALRGESEGPNMNLQIGAEIEGASGRVTIEVKNRAEDAVGIDIDSIRLRDSRGERYPALGAQQRFVRNGKKVLRRVPHGAITIAPGAQQSIALEFEKLPEKEQSYSLVLPAIYRLGIEGQVGLKAMRIPLEPTGAAAATATGGFYDPFAE